MINPETIIEISKLTIINSIRERWSFRKFGKRSANNYGLLVADMNLNITKNKIHGIVGESGSGKSLSMKSILGLIDIYPGIVSGVINYQANDRSNIEIISDSKRISPISKMFEQLNSMLQTGTEIIKTEYALTHLKDNRYCLSNHPIDESIELYAVRNNLVTKIRNYSLIERDNFSWIELTSNDNPKDELLIIRYKIKKNAPSPSTKRRMEKILSRNDLRGDKISMILQDPQTFLNPYWSIGEQLANIIKLKNKRQQSADYAERNYTIRIAGDADDYPVHLSWDKSLISKSLRYADLKANGDEINMLNQSTYRLAAALEESVGKQTVGKKFVAVIHLIDSDSGIKISWDKKYLCEKILEGTIIYNEGKKRLDKNMLCANAITIIDPQVNKKGEISIELLLLTESNVEFRSPLTISTQSYKAELIFGFEKDASDGLDSHKGEFPEVVDSQKNYSGFMINGNKTKSFILSRKDIKSPVNIYCQFPIITITPRIERQIEDFISSIEVTSKAGVKRLLTFGYSHSVKEYDDKIFELNGRDLQDQNTAYEAGFVLDGNKNIDTPSNIDIRNIDRMTDVDSEVSSLLSKVDLDDSKNEFRKKLPRAVSGGQSQRVMISLAMASKPEVLIADEPTTGLDVSKQREVIQLFQQYKAQGRTIILISHDMNFINHLADNYTIMYAGYDVEHVSAELLVNKRKLHPYTERLFEIATKGGEEVFDAIEHDIPDPYNRQHEGCPFFIRCHRVAEIGSDSKEHLCKLILPPHVDVSTGLIIGSSHINNTIHAVRCWLYANSMNDA